MTFYRRADQFNALSALGRAFPGAEFFPVGDCFIFGVGTDMTFVATGLELVDLDDFGFEEEQDPFETAAGGTMLRRGDVVLLLSSGERARQLEAAARTCLYVHENVGALTYRDIEEIHRRIQG